MNNKTIKLYRQDLLTVIRCTSFYACRYVNVLYSDSIINTWKFPCYILIIITQNNIHVLTQTEYKAYA